MGYRGANDIFPGKIALNSMAHLFTRLSGVSDRDFIEGPLNPLYEPCTFKTMEVLGAAWCQLSFPPSFSEIECFWG